MKTKSSSRMVDVDALRESNLNPRRHYDKEKIGELADSIKGIGGVIEPLIVRQNGLAFEIIAGARRFRAAKIAGLKELPVIVSEMSDVEALEVMLIENGQREDMNALEEAAGYKELLKSGHSMIEVAVKIGRPVRHIYDRMKLLGLIPVVKQLLVARKITPGHAVEIARLKPEDQERVIAVSENGFYDTSAGGLFEREDARLGLFADGKKTVDGPLAKYENFKARSIKELQAWIDGHVRFDKKVPDPMLFPETAEALNEAAEEKEKVIQITRNLQTPRDAKQGNEERIYHDTSWKRADGKEKSKTCEASVTGVVVIGPGRGEAFKVCVSKSCKVHWAKEQREKKATEMNRQSLEDRREEEQKKMESLRLERERERIQREAWDKALPELLKEVEAKIANASLSKLLPIVEKTRRDDNAVRAALRLAGKPRSLEHLAKVLVLAILVEQATRWNARERFPKQAKQISVDAIAIYEKFLPSAESKKNDEDAAKKKVPAKSR